LNGWCREHCGGGYWMGSILKSWYRERMTEGKQQTTTRDIMSDFGGCLVLYLCVISRGTDRKLDREILL